MHHYPPEVTIGGCSMGVGSIPITIHFSLVSKYNYFLMVFIA